VHRPRLVVCDEPTSALDHENGKRVMEILQRLAAEDGTTLVIVTHDSRVFHYADRIAHMDDGRVANIEEVRAASAIERIEPTLHDASPTNNNHSNRVLQETLP